MTRIFRLTLVFVLLMFSVSIFAQVNKWQEIYTAKKKDTLYGIAKTYGVTVEDLKEANPEMKADGYQLKKGDTVFVPFAKPTTTVIQEKPAAPQKVDVRNRSIRVGIMLPLHDVDGDGRRMVEYYRGFLLACDSLSKAGISTDIHAWNVPIDADIRQTLLEKDANKCDIIFGPLYTTQVKALGDFCKHYGIKMVIPFSINGDEVTRNSQIYQVYQSASELNNRAIESYLERFSDAHAVFIDCNDTTSTKGIFTLGLRNALDKKGIKYNLTNLKTAETSFAKAFAKNKRNVVVLNTAKSGALNIAIQKLKSLVANYPSVQISLFGYTEWLMYTRPHLENFFRFDTYVPTTFYYKAQLPEAKALEGNYIRWFGKEMQYALPRFAVTGYDQAQFFLRGLHQYGMDFKGNKAQRNYKALQTTYDFAQYENGGFQNRHFMLVHYTPDHSIEAINY